MAVYLKQQNLTRPFRISVEGNIGSGKTTFLERFKTVDGIHVMDEPVAYWKNLNGNNLLSLMYQNPEQWSFTFQSYVQLTMLKNHLETTTKPIKLMERSLFSAHYCFVEKLRLDGLLPEPSWAVLNEWFNWATDNLDVELDLIVYLKTSPEVAYERVCKRNRPEEKEVSLDFIQSMHNIHENWLTHGTLHKSVAPVLTINADLDKSCIEAEYNKWIPQILEKGSVAL